MSVARLVLALALFMTAFALPKMAHADPFTPVYEEEEMPPEPAPPVVVVPATNEDRPAPTPVPPKPSSVRGFVNGGASTASLFAVSSTAVHLGAGIGVESGRLFVPIMLDAELGQPPAGLGAGQVTLGIGFQGILGRVRLGGGADAGYGWITRASSSSLPHIGMYALDAFALATVDLFTLGERRAVYLGVKPSIGVRWGESFFAFDHGAVAYRATGLVGLRF